jgi:DNA topoisomerase-1
MILARTLATQCRHAVFNRTVIWIDSGPVAWVARGSVLVEQGYLTYWAPYAKADDEILPNVTVGEELIPSEYDLEKKETKPPVRYDEASLVHKMEQCGIGRPSTYAPTIHTLKNHDYVIVLKTGRGKEYLQATAHGLTIDALLTQSVPPVVTEEYTAEMERQLDAIESGKVSRVAYLTDWYSGFATMMGTASPIAKQFIKKHDLRPTGRGGAGEETKTKCDCCGVAVYHKIKRKKGSGSFLSCRECGFTRDERVKTKKSGCAKEGCGGTLVERKRKDGKGSFFACASKGCGYIENADGKPAGGSSWVAEKTDKPCPRCTKKKLMLVVKKDVQPDERSRDNAFHCCEDKEHCKFNLPFGSKRARIDCEKCGGMMLERWSRKNDRFYACAKCTNTRNPSA